MNRKIFGQQAVAIVLTLALALPSYAADTPEPKAPDLLSVEYAKLVADDSWHILTAPARWTTKDWLLAGLGTGLVVATAAWADKPLKEEFQNHRNRINDHFSEYAQKFGAGYSFAALGLFELEGIVNDDDNAKSLVEDGLAASLIASVVITPALKEIVGRSRPNRDRGVHNFSAFSGEKSFPSGHTTQAFAVASVIAGHYDSFWVKLGAYGLASAVAYARLERNAHWVSDVAAGGLIGTAVGWSVVKYNHDRRYAIMPMVEEDGAGVEIVHAF